MSNQTQKLEQLLARVQHNRESSVAKVAPVAAALPVPPMSKPEVGLPMVRPSASAVEPRVSQAQPAPLQRQPAPLQPAPLHSAPLQAPQTAVRVESVVLAAPRAAEPSKPIAQVTSRSSSTSAPTFGDLLRRSLSLRPR